MITLALLIAGDRDRRAGPRPRHALALGQDRRGADPRPAHGRLRPRAADADRLLHPHPDRRAGQPAEQRRDRRAAGLQRHALRRGQQRRHAGADPGRDAAASPGRSRCWRWSCCRSSCCRPGGWAPAWPRCEREAADHNADHEHPDDRAVLRARRDAGQAVRPAGARSRPSSRSGPAGCATSACAPRWCSGSSSPR